MKVKRFFAVSAIILVLAGGVFAANTIRRVKTTGLNTNNGTNWALSYKTLQAAMAVSDSTDTIWVAAGVYYDTVRIKNGVCMYGGFAGNESALSERNFRKYQTILDGGDSITPVKINTSAKAVVFNGFVVTRGLSKLGFAKGGAIFISSLAEPTIMNCLFLSNNANSGNGGAIYCSDYSKPSIANCNFIGNVGQLGGAIYSDTASLPLIVSNLFTQNRASRYGGAVMIYKASSSLITIMNNTFAYNSSSKGGAIYTFAAAASSRIANNIFLNNPTGVYCSLVIPSTRTNMRIYNNCFYQSPLTATGFTLGNTNITSDPKLVSFSTGDFHLQASSPCKNAGVLAVGTTPNPVQYYPTSLLSTTTDMDGEPRRSATVADSVIDMGYDEYTTQSYPQLAIRVATDGSDANDGSSWTLAKKTLMAGICQAALRGGDVWVKKGRYFENISLVPFVNLYGGFNTGDNALTDRNYKADTTIIDGNNNGNSVITSQAGEICMAVDGFTITNGKKGIAGKQIDLDGGAFFISKASPTIKNNTISGNVALGTGGGIYLSVSHSIIANNIITGNSSPSNGGDGGAIYSTGSKLDIYNNMIVRNSATRNGAGLFLKGDTSHVINNTIAKNIGQDGSAIYMEACSLKICNNIIAFNSNGVYRISKNAADTNALVRNNDLFGNPGYAYRGNMTGMSAGTNDKTVDPSFIDTAHNDFHISTASLCINAGSNADVGTGWLDIDGAARTNGATVDIGADESTASPVVKNEGSNVQIVTGIAKIKSTGSSAIIRFGVSHTSLVRLAIYDLQGALVAPIVNRTMEPGSYSAIWKTDRTSARGIFVCRFQCGDYVSSQRIVNNK